MRCALKVVTLETERLILRNYRLSDFEDHFKLCADPDVMRYLLGGKPMSRLEAWRHMAFLVGHWELLGYGYFAAVEKATGKFVGRIGFTNPEGWPGFEVGWTISPEFQGRGFATEGGRFLLQYAFDEMGRDHVISVIHPENKPSIRVAEKLGQKLEGQTDVGMPSWGGRITNDQIWMLTAYVRSLSSKDLSTENFSGKTVERTGH